MRLFYQRGVALPIALFMFLVMVMSSLYMMRKSSSTTAMASNLSYQRSVVQATDRGLEVGHTWLTTTASTNKSLLDANSASDGYVATYPYVGPNQPATYSDTVFWNGSTSTTFTDAIGNTITIEYVIHRYCTLPGPYNQGANSCVLSSTTSTTSSGAPVGVSLDISDSQLETPSRLHFLITARLTGGAKGASAINETIVMIGT